VISLRQLLAKWQSQREALAFAHAFHAESRARLDQLAALGQASQALRENVILLGIDPAKPERPRLASFGGVRP
jgi:hypothetical protein